MARDDAPLGDFLTVKQSCCDAVGGRAGGMREERAKRKGEMGGGKQGEDLKGEERRRGVLRGLRKGGSVRGPGGRRCYQRGEESDLKGGMGEGREGDGRESSALA